VGLLRWGGRGRRRVTGEARSRPCGAAQRSCAGAGPLPLAGAQLPVDCVLFLGGVAGAAAGLRRMPRGLCASPIFLSMYGFSYSSFKCECTTDTDLIVEKIA